MDSNIIRIPEIFTVNAFAVAKCALEGLVQRKLVRIEGCPQVGIVFALSNVVGHSGIYTREVRCHPPVGDDVEMREVLDGWLQKCRPIAESKLTMMMRANQLQPGMTNRHVVALAPHLIQDDDTIYLGGTNRLGLMCTGSGLADPWDDFMSGIVVEAIHAQFAMCVRDARSLAEKEGRSVYRLSHL